VEFQLRWLRIKLGFLEGRDGVTSTSRGQVKVRRTLLVEKVGVDVKTWEYEALYETVRIALAGYPRLARYCSS
jgi:hypothetical protein